MKCFKLTKHASERMQQRLKMPYAPRPQAIADYCAKSNLITEGNRLYIGFLNYGLFAIEEKPDMYIITTFIDKSSMNHGAVKRAWSQYIDSIDKAA